MEFFEKKAYFDISYLNTNKLKDNNMNNPTDFNNINNNENINIIDNNINNDNSNNKDNTNNTNPNELIYDVAIEMHALNSSENSINTDSTQSNINNKTIFVTLCKIIQEENQAHNHIIHCELQRIKTFSVWIDLYDVFNCALESGECLICCSNIRNTIFLPCKHSCTCNNCAHSLRMRNNPCPICKINIDDLLIIENENEIENNNNSNNNKINMDRSDHPFIKNNNNNNYINNNMDEEELGNEDNINGNNIIDNNINNENNVRID